MKKYNPLLIGLASILLLQVNTLTGATIAFNAPQVIARGSGDSSVINVGSEVYGIGAGLGSTVTLNNGSIFDSYTSSNVTLGNLGSAFSGFLGGGGTTGDLNFDTLLSNGRYGGGGAHASITLNNLTVGQGYVLQLFIADTRNIFNNGGIPYNRTFQVVNSVSDFSFASSSTYSFANGTSNVGAYVTGEFVADAATQQFFVQTFRSFDQSTVGPQINGLLLHTIPEPSTYATLLVSLILIGGISLKKKSSTFWA